ncbi:MAG TPA: hypothetical protein VGB89_13980 [Bacteroidota bacterium]
MKKMTMLLLLVTTFSAIGFAQGDDDIPIPPKRSQMAKIGGFGYFAPSWVKIDVNPINQFLIGAGAAPLKDNGIFMYGGGGAAYIILVPNLRIGGMGTSGSIRSTSIQPTPSGLNTVRRDVEATVGFGAITVEYVIPIVEHLDISIGGAIGWGGLDLQLREDNGSTLTWGQEWTNFGSGNYQATTGNQIMNITRTLSGSFLIWRPGVNIEYAFMGWLAGRIGVSYLGMSAPSWEVDGKYDLVGVPDNINGKGVTVNLGVMIGTF